MAIDEFWDSRPVDVYLKVQGHFEQEETRERNRWERARWMAFSIIRMNGFAKSTLQPRHLAVFPWEKKRTIEITSDQQRIFDKMDERIGELGTLLTFEEALDEGKLYE